MPDRSRLTPVVAVPARNEADRLPRLLSALSRQTWITDQTRPLMVHIVLNNTDDASSATVQAIAASDPRLHIRVADVVFPQDRAHVGSARRLAMDLALGDLADVEGGVLLTTDADAMPEPTWIDANLDAVAAGADAVGGWIIGDPEEEALLGDAVLRRARAQMRYAELCDRLSAHLDPIGYDPWPRHRDHTGASLAVTAAAYRAVDGLPAVPFREDLALISALRTAGFKLVHPRTVRVGVSARLEGRAPGGMADCLRGWIQAEAAGQPHLVEAPETVAERLRCRRAFRDSGAPDAGALIEQWAADDPDAWGDTPVLEAIARLEALIEQEAAHDVC